MDIIQLGWIEPYVIEGTANGPSNFEMLNELWDSLSTISEDVLHPGDVIFHGRFRDLTPCDFFCGELLKNRLI